MLSRFLLKKINSGFSSIKVLGKILNITTTKSREPIKEISLFPLQDHSLHQPGWTGGEKINLTENQSFFVTSDITSHNLDSKMCEMLTFKLLFVPNKSIFVTFLWKAKNSFERTKYFVYY